MKQASPFPISHNYLFIGGGSGGHITPLLAVAKALPDADIFFLCSEKKLDAEFLQQANVPFDTLPAPRRDFSFFASFIRNYKKTSRILRERNIDAVFSKGGAVSVPACLAAWRRKIPVVLHESDVVMGNANRVVAKIAARVCLGFPTSYKLQATTFLTGNPIRPDMTQGKKEVALKITGFTGTRPILLVVGGSQGAQAINDVITGNLDALLTLCDVIHITGTGKKKDITRPGYWASEMSSGQLHHFYAAADIAVSRASASMMTELAANSVPTILVPIRGFANDHQYKNAMMARDNGNCSLLLQEELWKTLVPEISRILADDGLRSQMRKNITTLSRPDASGRIAGIISECVASRKNLP